MIRVTWTGAAGLRFETGEQMILIDPYYTRIGIFPTLFAPISPDPAAIARHIRETDKITAVIVSHTHSDHALDVPYIAARYDGELVGSASLDTLMRIYDLPARTTICHGGETVALSDIAKVTMIRSTHGLVAFGKVPFAGEISPVSTLPMKAKAYRVGTAFMPQLELDGTCFLHTGSANFIEDELNGHTCDVLFLCVAGWQKRNGYPERIMELTQPKAIVLFHYDDFSRPHRHGARTRRMPFLDMPGLTQRIKSTSRDVDLIVPEIGETMTF